MTGKSHRIAILSDYQGVAFQFADWEPVRRQAEIVQFSSPFASIDDAAEQLAGFSIICAMRERVPFPEALLARLPALRCLVTTANINRAIDLEAARRLGIVVSGTRNGDGRRVTAELAWGLILVAARNLVQEERSVRAGGWQTGIGTQLHGGRLGIIGLGEIGEMVAAYGVAFGMDVLAWSENLTEERAAQCGARRVSKEELLRQSDVVTIHTVLSDRTRGLIGRAELAQMRPSAILVNTSRGAIVDEDALVEALASGGIRAAALDAFEQEPLPAGHPYRALGDRIILSPHIGYVTDEVYRIFYEDMVEAVLAFLDGSPIRRMA